jgi:hypothetical protein
MMGDSLSRLFAGASLPGAPTSVPRVCAWLRRAPFERKQPKALDAFFSWRPRPLPTFSFFVLEALLTQQCHSQVRDWLLRHASA